MDIIGGSTHGYAALLQALRRYQDAWINPKPFRMAHKIISDFLFPPYPQLRANDGILRVDSKEWLCLDTLIPSPVGSPIYQEYVFDKEQDLSVQIRDSRESPYSQIYLQSIASGSPHPLARHSVLKVVFHPTHRYVKKTCQLMRNILVAAFNYIYNPGSLSDIVLWDWPSGNLLYRMTQSVLGRFEPAFLDESYLVVFTTTRTYYSDDWREFDLFNFTAPLEPGSGWSRFQPGVRPSPYHIPATGISRATRELFDTQTHRCPTKSITIQRCRPTSIIPSHLLLRCHLALAFNDVSRRAEVCCFYQRKEAA
ncbi:hypothetical protein RSAG8_10993, partial [Rhizoctonia solani AG-8 WAC10335]